MFKRKLVLLSEEEENEPDDSSKESFISGKIITNFREKLVNSSKYVQDKIEKVNNLDLDESKTRSKDKNDKGSRKKLASNKLNENEIECVTLDDDSNEAPEPQVKQTVATVGNSKSTIASLDKPEIIDLDDEEEDDEVMLISDNCNVTANRPSLVDDELTSYEEFAKNKPMKVKVKRLEQIEYFELLRNQPMSTIFDEISLRFDIPVAKMIIYLNEKIVDAKATPNDLKLSFSDIFDLLSGTESSKDDPNFIELHLRDDQKKRMTLRIHRFDMVRKLAEFYANERGIEVETVHLEFDSDPMSLDKKIDFYDLEGDEQIDVIIKH